MAGGLKRARWKDGNGGIYEWDYRHGTVERYNRQGRHVGEFDAPDWEHDRIGDPHENRGTMNVINKLTGYDRRTERLRVEFALSAQEYDDVKSIARVPPAYEETFGSYPLADDVAGRILRLLDRHGDIEACTWFLEPFTSADA